MIYCEPCRQRGNYPASIKPEAGQCEFCKSNGLVHNVPARGIPLPGELVNSQENPFLDPSPDPRAQALQDARDSMAAGKGASVSLSPNYEMLKTLTKWLADNGWSATQVADAVARPQDYWPLYEHGQKGGP